MTDQELAERVLQEGVGDSRHECYWIDNAGLSAYEFIREWRTAGELIRQRTAIELIEIFGRMSDIINPSPLRVIEETIGWLDS